MNATKKTLTTLTADLRRLGVRPGDLLMVHSSLRRLGPVVGGAAVVVQSLLDAVGPGGTLLAYVDFEPFFEDYGVRIVLCGHMHGYERFQSGNIVYVVSGGGGGLLGDVSVAVAERPDEAALRLASARAFHAMMFEVGAESLDGSAIDENGDTLDSFSIPLP